MALNHCLFPEAYNYSMARGWESKAVEAQQEEAAGRTAPEKPRLTREQATRIREQESLRLSLKRVLQELQQSRNPTRRAMLESARTELERKIADSDPAGFKAV